MDEYIDREKTCGECIHAVICKKVNGSGFSPNNIAYCGVFKNAADVVEVVRCKDCKKWEEIKHGQGWCTGFAPSDVFSDYDYFCSNGERKNDG